MMRGMRKTLGFPIVRRFIGPIAGLVFGLCLAFVPPGASVAQTTEAATETDKIPLFIDPNRLIEKPSEVPGSITFLTTIDFPPFNFLTPEGRLTGFHVDLTREICDELKVRCQIRVVSFDRIVRNLVDGKGDAAIAGLAETKRTRRRLRFTLPYLRLAGRFTSNKRNPVDLSNKLPDGASVAVVGGSVHADFLAQYFPKLKAENFADAQAARAALKEEKVDLHFGDSLSLAFWLQSETAESCCGFHGGAYFDETYFGRGLSIALPQEATSLRSTLNYALQRVVATGKFAELYLRYFPISLY